MLWTTLLFGFCAIVPKIVSIGEDSILFNARMALSHVPSCAKDLTFYVYELPSKFNNLLLNSIELLHGDSQCDFARSPCLELTRDPHYSNVRQYAADVPILAKFLSLNLTNTPQQADFFVVPFYSAVS